MIQLFGCCMFKTCKQKKCENVSKKFEICNSQPSHSIILRTVLILFILLGRVFIWLFHYIWQKYIKLKKAQRAFCCRHGKTAVITCCLSFAISDVFGKQKFRRAIISNMYGFLLTWMNLNNQALVMKRPPHLFYFILLT